MPSDDVGDCAKLDVLCMMASSGVGGSGGRDVRMDSTLAPDDDDEDPTNKSPTPSRPAHPMPDASTDDSGAIVPQASSSLRPEASEFTPSGSDQIPDFMSSRPNVQTAPRLQSVDDTPISPTTTQPLVQEPPRELGPCLESPDPSSIPRYAPDSLWQSDGLSPLPHSARVRPPQPGRFIIGPDGSSSSSSSQPSRTTPNLGQLEQRLGPTYPA